MGIDAVMAVALKKGAHVPDINLRFKETHSFEDSIFWKKEEDLVQSLAPRDWASEYENTYVVNTGLVRYYSIGYERGPACRIVTQLEWLRTQPEVIEVFYGGDCSDSPSLWTAQDSADLLMHFFKVGHTPYSKWTIGSWKLDSIMECKK